MAASVFEDKDTKPVDKMLAGGDWVNRIGCDRR